MRAIILKGNPCDGFVALGPFPSRVAAVEHGDTVDSEWWVLDLEEVDDHDHYAGREGG